MSFSKRPDMTDPDLQQNKPANPEQASEGVVSKPYVMPDDPEQGSAEALTKELTETRDNLQRALDAVPSEARANADPGLKALIEGVELTERSLLNTLEKNGVKKFDPMGQKFDPNFQQAMFEVPDPSVPSGTVVQVVQAGYMIGERVLRPALVGVSKGGAKASAATPANGKEPDTA